MLWILLSLGSAVFHSLSAIFDKKVLKHEHALEFGASQSLATIVLCLFLIPLVSFNHSWYFYLALYGISAIFVAGNLYYLKSMRHSQISSAYPLMNLSPLFLLFIAFFLLGEQPSFIDLSGVLLLIIGTYVLQMAGHGRKDLLAPFRDLTKNKYSLYMIFALFIFSLTATLEKGVINRGMDALSLFVIARIFIGINFLLVEFKRNGFSEIVRNYKKDGRNIIYSAVFGSISAIFYFFALSQPGVLVSLVIPLKRTSTLLATLFGGKLFGEDHLGMKAIGCVVMIIGVAIIAL